MGRASSSKKIARASKVSSPSSTRSFVWPAAIGAVVVLGILLVVVSRGGNEGNDLSPKIGEHWHVAYGVYDCDSFIGPQSDTLGDKVGIHTHQDGLIHMHPITTAATGKRATLRPFAEEVGMELTDTSIKTANGMSRKNGDKCGDAEGEVQLWVWDSLADEEGRRITEDLIDYKPANSSLLTLAFAPAGTKIPMPPQAGNLSDPTAAEEGRPTPVPADTPTASTVPADPATATTASPTTTAR